jgi:hypothetical protein
MAVYQKFPDSIGLDSVAWKLTTVPRSGSSGVTWKVDYNVALASYRQTKPLGVYYGKQVLGAKLGQEWEIKYQDGCQQLFAIGELSPDLADHIVIHNNSGLQANPGIGMNGTGSAFKRNVLGKATAQFKVTPTYYVGLFRDVILGEVISSNVEVGPVELKFSKGANVANIQACLDGESIELDTSYSRT